MFDLLIEKYKVDETKIFISGWSNGGMMAYKLICKLSSRIAAASSFVGNLM